MPGSRLVQLHQPPAGRTDLSGARRPDRLNERGPGVETREVRKRQRSPQRNEPGRSRRRSGPRAGTANGPRSGSIAITAVAWVVLVLGLAVCSGAALTWKSVLDEEALTEQRSSASAASAVVASNLALNDNLMAQLAAMAHTFPDMTNDEFRTWWEAAGIQERFAGGMGFTFIEIVAAEDLPAFAARQEQDPIFGTPAGPLVVMNANPAGAYCLPSVGVWEFDEVNGFKVPPGIDFCAEELLPGQFSPVPPVMDAAVDSGRSAVFPPEIMAADAEVFGLAVPIYRDGEVPGTVEARRAEVAGWILGSFRSDALVAGATEGHPELDIEVAHHDRANPDGVVHAIESRRELHVISTVDVGPSWTIRVAGPPVTGDIWSDPQPLALLVVGLVVSLLAFLFIRVLGTSRDRALALVAERTRELAHQAMHDDLTGLPNRGLIRDRAEGVLERARRDGTRVAAMFIDLDDFKAVNDTLGHGAGDELLVNVARRLERAVRAGDSVGRLGGDEFVIVLEGQALSAGPEVVAERILDVLHEPLVVAGEPLRIAASIGIAAGPRPTADDWLRDADIALYEAKASGKDTFAVFESDMHDAVHGRVALERDLHNALDDGQFFLEYQPMFSLQTNQMTGVEALLRWRHPTKGTVAPDDFIPTAERVGAIVPIGRWVLHEACHQAAAWQDAGHPLVVAVNLSVRQLEQDVLVEHVRLALLNSGLRPELLLLEITETALMRDVPDTDRRLQELKALGVRLAIDDFGTGYSSMAYLRRFPVDVLKIDRSFIAGIGDSDEAAVLVRTLVQMGRALGLETLGEGIEDQAQLDGLVREHCDSGQGFLFSRPTSPEAIGELLVRRPGVLSAAGAEARTG